MNPAIDGSGHPVGREVPSAPVVRKGTTARHSISRTSTATRLAASVVAISLISLVVATIVGITTGEDLSDDLNDDRLRATVESSVWDVSVQLRGYERTTASLASSLQAAAAVEAFGEAFSELRTSVDEDEYLEEFDQLIAAYREEYLAPLQDAGRDVQLRDITSSSPAAAYLQYEYAIDIGAATRAATVDDANDGSAWTDVHRRVHPVYRDVVNRLDLVDLYLVDASGSVLYTVNKRPDLGSNLRTGPYSGSVVANTFRRAVNNPDLGSVTSDLGFYDAIPGVPIGVVGSPIRDGGRVVGVLMVSYGAPTLTDLVTADETYEAAGLPETGDVYVIGSDGITRTDPRPYLEDPTAYLDAAEAAGRLTADERNLIEAIDTTVLTQPAAEETLDAGLEGNVNVRDASSIDGAPVLSVTAPVASESVEWFVVAEINADAAQGRLDDFQELLIVGAAVFVVLLAFLAVAWANAIVRPVRHISERISRGGRREGPIEVPPQTPVEIQQLAGRLAVMKDALTSQQAQIATARNERLELLNSMLPPSVAARIATGDVRSLEQAPAASVVVVVVLGLADLVRAAHGHQDRELVDRLLAELDDLALERGLDRIKVVGDAYFAACGHDRQYVDHSPRAVGFAIDAMHALRALQTEVPLDLAVGIHSGPVTTGMAGGASLVYDVWGPTVSGAHRLARLARAGQILVSAESRGLLPDAISTEPIGNEGSFLVVPSAAEVGGS